MKHRFRIVDLPTGDYGLVDESTDMVIRTGESHRDLSDWAFLTFKEETEVRHEEDHVKAENVPWRK